MNAAELLGFFDPKLCLFDLKATSQEEALEEIVAMVAAQTNPKNHGVILEMLRNRESLGSTAVGNGVAFPHGRSLAVSNLMAIFARSQKGVSFSSLDGEPTHLFFVLLAPPQDRQNQYLPALGKIIESVKKDALREKLMKVTSFEEFAEVIQEGAAS